MHGGDIDFARHRFAQQRPRAKCPAAHGCRGYAETCGRLVDRHLLDFAQNERRPELIRQRVDVALQQPPHFAAACGGVGLLGTGVGHCVLLGVALAGVPRVGLRTERQDDTGTLALAQKSIRFVDDDAAEPCGQARAAAKTRDVAKRGEIGILDCIFRFGVVAQDRPGDAVEHLVVAAHQKLERTLVAAADAAGEFDVVQRIGCAGSKAGRFHCCHAS